jgi:predicted dehydrogenase
VDLSGIETYSNYKDLLADPNIQIVDICLPTPLHAGVAIDALRAGKDVLCEKPAVRHASEAEELLGAWKGSGRRLLIGHCLRYWGQYVQAAEIIASGEYGKPLYASFHRSSGTPKWSWENWLATGPKSGGAILDMHVHDIDAALWWFGSPKQIQASGYLLGDLPALVDATWTYEDGPLVHLHGSWDDNDTPFHYAFKVIMEKGTLEHDSAEGTALRLSRAGRDAIDIEFDSTLAYQAEINDLVDSVARNRPLTRVMPESSILAVQAALEEIRQISLKSKG